MLKMKTLTIGDKTYQLWDPEAARVEDSAVGENPWSSQKLVETFCPKVTTTNNTFRPVAGSPLQVGVDIRFTQAGSGAPGYQNVRPITGCSQLQLTHNDERHALALGQEVFCGRLDCASGRLTLTHKYVTFTGEEDGWRQEGVGSIIHYGFFNDATIGEGNGLAGWCSHVPTGDDGKLYWNPLRKGWRQGYAYIVSPSQDWGLPDNSVQTWIDYLKAQTAAGTPVQVVYSLEQPLTLELTPVQITALSGENTLSCDGGAATVTYFADPKALLEKLCIE